jgi:hypothetical protein
MQMSAQTRQCLYCACLGKPDTLFRSGCSLPPQKTLPVPGLVVYRSVPAMRHHKIRPCVVIAKTRRKTWLLPLSSDTWNPSVNPVVGFNGNLSFAVLDRLFSVPTSELVGVTAKKLSTRGLNTCVLALRNASVGGRTFLPNDFHLAGYGKGST